MFAAILGNFKNVDELSTWALGATGGIAGLLVANLGHLTDNMKPGWGRWLPTFLSVSAVLGIFEKLLSFQTKTFNEISEKSFEAPDGPVANISKLLIEEAKANPATATPEWLQAAMFRQIKETSNEIRAALPWFGKLIMDHNMKKAETDPLAMYRVAVKIYFLQVEALLMQLVALIVLIAGLPFATHL